ncbi:MAG: phosphoribosylformylglycinamidine cyclo-ligase [candidate division FCPU426 bacterium]
MKKSVTYRSAGVNIDEGQEAVRRMKGYVRTTFNKNVLGDLGSFGGLFKFDKNAFKKPVLVSSTDGVGTKILVAAAVKRYHTVGQDLVNHCVNDILVQGAKPLFFLDYYATGKLDAKACAETVRGLAIACKQQGCVLIGGETAEMPGLYQPGDFDLAGTIVGAVEEDQVLTGEGVKPGDQILGLPSVGLHTNGFSLARKVLLRRGVSLTKTDKELGESLADALLKPHRCYAKELLPLIKTGKIRALAHLTGGGFYDNIPRVLPEGCHAVVYRGSWPVLPIFKKIVREGGVPEKDAYRTLNMGIGMVVIVREADQAGIQAALKRAKMPSYLIGRVTKGPASVDMV